MRHFSAYVLAALLVSPLPGADPIHTFTQVEMVPVGTFQLGDAAFAAPEVFDKLEMEKGTAVLLYTDDGKSLQAFLYPIDRSPESISIKKSSRDSLDAQPGEAIVHMRLLEKDEISIERVDGDVRVESYAGDPARWPRMVVGAPHGDCDLYTGEIVSLLAQNDGIPAVAAYGPRISYVGRWIDVNRPLQREPKPLYGIQPYRSWTKEAEGVYEEFRSRIIASVVRHSEGEVPLDFYLDLHGHDLTVKTPEGKTIGRDLSEGMARGFSLAEVRQIKTAFDNALRSEYGEDAPPSYWGNLPEDRVYTVEGVEAEFFYSGLGGRVYGALASDVSRRCIHIETPNGLRLNPENRKKTARALAKFLGWMKDDMLAGLNEKSAEAADVNPTDHDIQWLEVKGGEFTMGAKDGEGWDSLGPAHQVMLSTFEISSTEITNEQYAKFANDSLSNKMASLEAGVLDSDAGEKWIDLWPAASLSQLYKDGEKVAVREGYENHPVVEVTWHGAVAFADSMNARLPTESEWEYIAGWDPEKGEPKRWSERRDREYLNLPIGNFMHSDFAEKHPNQHGTTSVGSFPDGRSPVGCFDTTGNVWEWTSDWFADYSENDSIATDPSAPESGTMKSVRGGAWDTEASTVTPVFRLGVAPHATLATLGFRIAR